MAEAIFAGVGQVAGGRHDSVMIDDRSPRSGIGSAGSEGCLEH